MAIQKVITFAPFIRLATQRAESLQINVVLMTWKIQLVKEDDSIRAAEFNLRFHFRHPGNRAEMFITQNFPPVLPRSRMEKWNLRPLSGYELDGNKISMGRIICYKTGMLISWENILGRHLV